MSCTFFSFFFSFFSTGINIALFCESLFVQSLLWGWFWQDYQSLTKVWVDFNLPPFWVYSSQARTPKLVWWSCTAFGGFGFFNWGRWCMSILSFPIIGGLSSCDDTAFNLHHPVIELHSFIIQKENLRYDIWFYLILKKCLSFFLLDFLRDFLKEMFYIYLFPGKCAHIWHKRKNFLSFLLFSITLFLTTKWVTRIFSYKL